MVIFKDNEGNEISKEEFDRINNLYTDAQDEIDETLSVDELLMSILITNMRLYDVQMALLTLKDEKTAARLNAKHQSGGIVGSMPSLRVEE